MRVAITGATGNVGTSLVDALAVDESFAAVVGIARRAPALSLPKVDWVEADVAKSDLVSVFSGCDAIVHLAWLIQPSRDESVTYRANVVGSIRVFEAAAAAGVRRLVYASSVGAYAPGPQDRLVDESWPTTGVPSSFYSRHKAEVESLLDDFSAAHTEIRVVRLRPALIFKATAASGIRRLFAGPLLPAWLLEPSRLPFVPSIQGLRFQAVHSRDVADAYRRALVADADGAFNIAADPVLDTRRIADALGKRSFSVPPGVARAAAAATWKLRLQPTPPGWLDMGMQTPLMDATRARAVLHWKPEHSSMDALVDLLKGLGQGEDADTPPLARVTGGPLRWREWMSGIGRRS